MTIARYARLSTPPRMRIHSFAVWDTSVFLLNVLAFLLMGLQARTIVGGMQPDRLLGLHWP
jgi:monovalent cation/hydrogen antiporter